MTARLIIILTLISTSIFAQVDCKKYPDKYIPNDLEDALNFLDCKWSKSEKDTFRLKPENVATVELHFGTGMGIRNSWGLWKGDSGIAKYFRDLGINHPDDMSGIILTSFHRYLNKADIKLDEQVQYYKAYWEESKRKEEERKREEFSDFNVNDTVEFGYDFDFITKRQEKKWLDDKCIAKGIIISKDSVELRLQVKLIESCDKKGIIISKGDIYKKENEEWVLIEKNRIELMQIGEIKWTDYSLWEGIY